MNDKDPRNDCSAEDKGALSIAGKLSRRALVRGAAPMVLSLGSGAALARSSNLIGASTEGAAKDLAGNTLCLDSKSVFPVDTNTYDFGPYPGGTVYRISERDYHNQKNASPASAVSEGQMCNLGGTYHYHSGNWQQVNLPRGILVSAQAIGSFATSIVTIDV